MFFLRFLLILESVLLVVEEVRILLWIKPSLTCELFDENPCFRVSVRSGNHVLPTCYEDMNIIHTQNIEDFF